MGMALKENGSGKLFAIDPHTQTNWNDHLSVDTFAVIQKNFSTLRLHQQVEILRKTSSEAAAGWNQPIDLIFIDGDHSYEGVKRDWELFIPHMSEFGVVVFHDTMWDRRPDPRWSRPDMGVPRFVEELRQLGYPVITLDKDCGLSMVQTAKGGVPLARESITCNAGK
jgi:predicted O-methyltransferase YrrM